MLAVLNGRPPVRRWMRVDINPSLSDPSAGAEEPAPVTGGSGKVERIDGEGEGVMG